LQIDINLLELPMQRRAFISRNLVLAVSAPTLAVPLLGRAEQADSRTEIPKVSGPGGRTLRVGLVELDTSHADTIAAAMARLEGVEIAAVTNRGLVYGPERTAKFVADYKVKKVCRTVEEMAPLVDVALVLGVDWNSHVADAEPFIRAGVPVFVDKPCVGSEADARRLLELRVKYGTPVFGGSTYRYNRAFQDFRQRYGGMKDKVALTIYGKINSHSRDDMLDLIYYGIHGVEVMGEVAGPGAVRVSYLDFYRKQHLIHVHYDNRPPVILMLGWALKISQAALLTGSTVETVAPSADEGAVYPTILSRMAASIATRREDRPIDEQIESCRILIAAQKSRDLGRPVFLTELEPEDGFDGGRFGLEYSRFRNLPPAEQGRWRENEI
jgi:virulence factor